jgi:membrane fusion protein (multidrug efflux system)
MRQVAELEGTQSDAASASARLAYSIGQRTLRAPVDGIVAEISPLRAGSMVAAGQRIATIVPDGGLRVVAQFQPSDAIGRIRAGQPARVRLEAYPWAQYGSVAAVVTSVAGEPHDGRVRVELELASDRHPAVVVQHGLTAAVDVEVEQASPATLVLRSIGARLRAAAAEP